ncbi:MAG: hypothetical protein Q9178_006101 [Gyalolechia marmorata]
MAEVDKSHFWQFGGALLDDVPQPGQSLKICGSAMLVQADSREEVLQVIQQDIYSKNGVWDLEKVQIYPFKCAFRKGLEKS